MRSYKQYCALAKALDVIGDRWTLLIVRELLIRGRSRYTDLQDGLPGIASNLLALRMRELEQAGLVRRDEAAPPVATTLFALTPRGEELEAVVHQLGRWGAPLLREIHRGDAFRTHWLALPAGLHLKDRTPERPPITIEVHAGGEPLLIETIDGKVRIRPGRAENPDAILTGKRAVILGVLTGKLKMSAARVEGNRSALRRVLPTASSPTKSRRASA